MVGCIAVLGVVAMGLVVVVGTVSVVAGGAVVVGLVVHHARGLATWPATKPHGLSGL